MWLVSSRDPYALKPFPTLPHCPRDSELGRSQKGLLSLPRGGSWLEGGVTLKAAEGVVCGVNSLLMSPAPRATNEPRPAALIDVKKLETPRSASCLPAASPEPPPPPCTPSCSAPFPGPPFHLHQQTRKGLRPPSSPPSHPSGLLVSEMEADMLWRGLGHREGTTDQSLKITVQGQTGWC